MIFFYAIDKSDDRSTVIDHCAQTSHNYDMTVTSMERTVTLNKFETKKRTTTVQPLYENFP